MILKQRLDITVIALSLAYVIEALILHRGNRTHTARYLKIPLKTLRCKIGELKALRIDVPDYEQSKRLDYCFTAEQAEDASQ